MSYASYIQAMGTFFSPPGNVVSVLGPAGLALFLPHLDADERHDLCDRVFADPGNWIQCIGPPIQFVGCEHVMHLSVSDYRRIELKYDYCWRRRESYSDSYRRSRPETAILSTDFEYRERVSNYAAVNWGEGLQWNRCEEFFICRFWYPQPDDQGAFLKKSSIPPVYIGLKARRSTLGPVMAQFNDRISFLTSNHAIGLELTAQQVVGILDFCADCGGGLQDNHCAHCYQSYSVEASLVPTMMAVPMQVIELPEIRQAFTNDPVMAIKAHYGEWARDDYILPPTAIKTTERERVVKMRELDDEHRED